MAATASNVRNILITGSSRGLGLEFVHQYLAEPKTHVIATARNLVAATALQELKQKHSNLTLLELDVSSPSSIVGALKSLPPISLLINNAGVFQTVEGTGTATAEDFSTTFNTNVTGTLLTTQAALPALRQAAAEHHIRPVVVNISSFLGSIQSVIKREVWDGKTSAAYRISKAALNMLTGIAAQEHPDLTFLALSPGWVDTDLGNVAGGTPPLTPAQSISGMRAVIDKLKPEQSGHFLSYDGSELQF